MTSAAHQDSLQVLREYRNLAPWNLRDLAGLVGAILDPSALTPINPPAPQRLAGARARARRTARRHLAPHSRGARRRAERRHRPPARAAWHRRSGPGGGGAPGDRETRAPRARVAPHVVARIPPSNLRVAMFWLPLIVLV